MDLREARPDQTRRHPWELARVAALRRLLAGVPLAAGDAVLEVGCGDGYAAGELFAGRALAGVDPHLSDEQLAALTAARPGHTYVRRLEELPGPRARARLLLLLDVLEHVEDDAGLLRRLVERHLAPGGHALITAPAFPALFSAHDRYLRHLRRYSRRELTAVAERAGLRCLRGGFLFASLLPPRALSVGLQRLAPSWQPRSLGVGGWRRGILVSRAVELALRADNQLLIALADRGIRLPGLTTWTICRGP